MPAKRPKHGNADATANPKTPNKTARAAKAPTRIPAQSHLNQTARAAKTQNQTKKPGPQGPQLHVSGIAAIVSGMALSKFPFLSLQAGKLLRSLALARLPR
ncbi:hypothetical protein PTKU64_20790 [Paraburkholderia terrae]|uniref:Uncharacterized protein n=1 Tax=Paraburkholderia terrae TaxID=311230 RepID=A0ABM7TJL8_9BURK|nr:hypothetical protein PTKU64_20790 [Paraburkholderia terrae]